MTGGWTWWSSTRAGWGSWLAVAAHVLLRRSDATDQVMRWTFVELRIDPIVRICGNSTAKSWAARVSSSSRSARERSSSACPPTIGN